MRPFIHVNCAMSADGKIAGPERKQVTISTEEDLLRVRNLRKHYDAILVGVGTIVADDSHLTIKGAYRDAIDRIVIDPNGRTPDNARVLDNVAPTVIVTCGDCKKTWSDSITVIRTGTDRLILADAMESLARDYDIKNILVEGGGTTIASFFRENMVDKYTVFVSGMIIGGKDAPTPVEGDDWVVPGGIRLDLKSTEVFGNGVLLPLSRVPTIKTRNVPVKCRIRSAIRLSGFLPSF